MIAGLIAALIFYDGALVAGGGWTPAPLGATFDAGDIAPLLGLLIVVQGFETSRFLGSEYPAALRIRTMKASQIISAAIYLVFFVLVLPLYAYETKNDGVAAIVDMLAPVASILPAMVILGALASQSSAAIADANGAAGLLNDLSRHRILVRSAYPMIAGVAAFITWETNVFGLIALASRSFAFYYALQCLVALLSAWRRGADALSVGYGRLRCSGLPSSSSARRWRADRRSLHSGAAKISTGSAMPRKLKLPSGSSGVSRSSATALRQEQAAARLLGKRLDARGEVHRRARHREVEPVGGADIAVEDRAAMKRDRHVERAPDRLRSRARRRPSPFSASIAASPARAALSAAAAAAGAGCRVGRPGRSPACRRR